MNVVRCRNGHFFDGDSYQTCPHCGDVIAATEPMVQPKEEKKGFWGRGRKEKTVTQQPINEFANVVFPKTDVLQTEEIECEKPTPPLEKSLTLDFWQTPSHSSDETSKVEVEESVIVENFTSNNENILQEENANSAQREEKKTSEPMTQLQEAVKNASASNEGKTMSYFSMATATSSSPTQKKRSAEPVVGWLVCVGGCYFGECFNIYAGNNTIGRSSENRIAISDDNSVSRVKHALIVYEPKKREFYIQPGDSSGLTYVNDEYIVGTQKLKESDIIELGDSKFMFVPLCGKTFSWEEHMQKGE